MPNEHPMEDNSPGQYVIGRGKLYLNGRYYGQTDSVTFAWEDGVLLLKVKWSSFRAELCAIALAAEKIDAEVRYVADNPVGRDTSFSCEGRASWGDVALKQESDWLGCTLTIVCGTVSGPLVEGN